MNLNQILIKQINDFIANKIATTLSKEQSTVSFKELVERADNLNLSALDTLKELTYKLEDEDYSLTESEYSEIVKQLKAGNNIAETCYDVARNTDYPYLLQSELEGDSEYTDLMNEINRKLLSK